METESFAAPELGLLAAFRAVCAEGGFTAAAARLRCTQPAVSYQIQKLEERLGVRLLERGGRAIVLTAEGRRVLQFADAVFEELARVRAECRAGERLEPLRLGSASGFGRYVLMPAVRALWQETSSTGELDFCRAARNGSIRGGLRVQAARHECTHVRARVRRGAGADRRAGPGR